MASTDAPPRARIVHRMPGRMRVRFARGSMSPEALSDLSRAVLKVKGVERCDASGSTACLLIHFDEATFDDKRLATAVGGIVDAPTPRNMPRGTPDTPEPAAHGGRSSRLAHMIEIPARHLDERLRRATGGHVDLRTILPIGFAALALREIVVRSGALPAIPWYVLLWYAFDSYLRLQNTPTGKVTSSLMKEAMEDGGGGE